MRHGSMRGFKTRTPPCGQKSSLWLVVLIVALLGGATVAGASFASVGATARPQMPAELNQPGLAARDNAEIGTPPDTTGAIGSRHYLETVNVRLALFDRRTLRQVTARDAYAFWNKPNTGTVVDPQVTWDRDAERWYYVALFTEAGKNEVLVSWSKAGDPASLDQGWCRISIDTGKLFDDFPKLGYSPRNIYIGTNVADISRRRVLFSRLWVIAKPAKQTCNRPKISSFGRQSAPFRQADGRAAFTLVPVHPAVPSNTGYMIAADCIDEGPSESEPEAYCGAPDKQGHQITVWKVTGPAGSPRVRRLGGINVPTYRLPTPVPQPGTNKKIETSDTRLTEAVSAPDPTLGLAEAIWTQQTVAGPHGRSVVRWYELDPHRLRLVRSGTISDPRDWVFNGAISPTSRGDAAEINYNVGGPAQLALIRAQFRGPNTPPDEIGGTITLSRSEAPDQCEAADPDEPCSWGDYAAATPDPLHSEIVWGSNQLLAPTSQSDRYGFHWRTQNFALEPIQFAPRQHRPAPPVGKS